MQGEVEGFSRDDRIFAPAAGRRRKEEAGRRGAFYMDRREGAALVNLYKRTGLFTMAAAWISGGSECAAAIRAGCFSAKSLKRVYHKEDVPKADEKGRGNEYQP